MSSYSAAIIQTTEINSSLRLSYSRDLILFEPGYPCYASISAYTPVFIYLFYIRHSVHDFYNIVSVGEVTEIILGSVVASYSRIIHNIFSNYS